LASEFTNPNRGKIHIKLAAIPFLKKKKGKKGTKETPGASPKKRRQKGKESLDAGKKAFNREKFRRGKQSPGDRDVSCSRREGCTADRARSPRACGEGT